MALTDTLTKTTLATIIARLALISPAILATSLQRNNIYYSVVPWLAKQLSQEFDVKRVKFPKTVIFCRLYTDCSDLYMALQRQLGSRLTEPPDYPDLSEFRMAELYTKVSKPAKREDVVDLKQEHLNRRLKGMLRSLGSNITSNAIIRAGKCLATIDTVCVNFEEKTSNTSLQFGVHHHPAFGKDLSKIVEVLIAEDVFEPRCRFHASFNYKEGLLQSKPASNDEVEKKVNNIIQL